MMFVHCCGRHDRADPSSINGLLNADESDTTMAVANSATTVANMNVTTNNNNNNNDVEGHLVVNTASSSVEQCSAITDRFQEKINKQQETIERLNNALEEVREGTYNLHTKLCYAFVIV